MLIKRYLEDQINTTLNDGKIAIIYGARQTGKTTLVKLLLSQNPNSLYLNCDEPEVRSRLSNKGSAELKSMFGEAKFIVIDEAQRVANIGITAKLIHDTYPEIKLVITGSSSIELANTIKEPLTGRAYEHILYPLALTEVSTNIIEATGLLGKSLVLGGYPGMWQLDHEKAVKYLRDLADNYLYKDAFAVNVYYDASIIDKLLQLLAYQIGNEVSYNELANHIEVDKKTVMRYIDLLEKAFIVFRVNQYRRNQRNEIGRLRKVYFYDLGVRNGLIDNFLPLDRRNDVGALWENYCMIERRKYLQKNNIWARQYFWRSYSGQEVDLVEEISTETKAYEFKYKNSNIKLPPSFASSYPDVPLTLVSRGSFNRFIF